MKIIVTRLPHSRYWPIFQYVGEREFKLGQCHRNKVYAAEIAYDLAKRLGLKKTAVQIIE